MRSTIEPMAALDLGLGARVKKQLLSDQYPLVSRLMVRSNQARRGTEPQLYGPSGACAIGRMPEKLERRRVLGFIGTMKTLISASALVLVAACASHTPYGPAKSSGAVGYETQKIETNRYRVSYTDRDAGRSHDMALLRAAEITLQDGRDWFEITGGYTDQDGAPSGSRTSVSVGGSTGSRPTTR